MKKLLLRGLLVDDELHIIDQQDINRAVLGAKLVGRLSTNGIDQPVGKGLGRDIEGLLAIEHDLVADGMEQMRLAKPDPTIDKQRVIGIARVLSHGHASSMSQAIGLPHDERRKSILGVDASLVINASALYTAPRASPACLHQLDTVASLPGAPLHDKPNCCIPAGDLSDGSLYGGIEPVL